MRRQKLVPPSISHSKADATGMKKPTAPQIHYHSNNDHLAEQRRRLDKAFDLLFDEVMRMRLTPRDPILPVDSTPLEKEIRLSP